MHTKHRSAWSKCFWHLLGAQTFQVENSQLCGSTLGVNLIWNSPELLLAPALYPNMQIEIGLYLKFSQNHTPISHVLSCPLNSKESYSVYCLFQIKRDPSVSWAMELVPGLKKHWVGVSRPFMVPGGHLTAYHSGSPPEHISDLSTVAKIYPLKHWGLDRLQSWHCRYPVNLPAFLKRLPR